MEYIRKKVILVEDDHSVRTAMRRLFTSQGLDVATYSCASQFLDAPPVEHDAVCLVLDIRLPDGNGLEIQRELQARDRHLPIIFITGYGDISMGVQAMKRGAVDFLPKPVDDSDLLEAVNEALKKNCEQKDASNKISDLRARISRLTPREHQVLEYIIAGLLNKQVAYALGISEKTVKVHRARIMAKLEVCSVADLVRLCEQAKIVPAPFIESYR